MTSSQTLATHTTRPAIHEATGPLGAALAAIPTWAEVRARLDQLDAFASAAGSSPGDIEPKLVALIEGAALSGKAASSDLLAQVAAVKAEHDAAMTVAAVCNRVQAARINELDAAATEGADIVFEHLHVDLERLLAEAAEVLALLGPVRTAEDALRADKGDVWRRLGPLQARYVDLRRAQQTMFAKCENRGRHMRQLTLAYIGDPAAVDPDHLPRRLGQQIKAPIPGGGWRMRDAAPVPWPELHGPDALAWLVSTPDAQPWVPGMRDLEAAEETAIEQTLAYAETTRRAATRRHRTAAR